MALPQYLLDEWRKFSEEQIASAGPGALEFYRTSVKPQLEKKPVELNTPATVTPVESVKKPVPRRRTHYPNPEDCALNRLRRKCALVTFRVRNCEREDLLNRAASQKLTFSEFLRRQALRGQDDANGTLKTSLLTNESAVPTDKTLIHYEYNDTLPRRCMVRFRVSPKEMLFYQQEVEKRGFVSMADFFREAVRRMIHGN